MVVEAGRTNAYAIRRSPRLHGGNAIDLEGGTQVHRLRVKPGPVLRFEEGIHRAHHVPDEEISGRIHTSTAIVRLLDGDPAAASVASWTRVERVRTYNYPEGLVTDHRIDLIVSDLPSVLDGGLDEITAALEANDMRP